MQKLNRGRGRLLLSTCLSGVALAWAPGAQAQAQDKAPTWKPRAEVDARAADGSSQVSFELFAPVAQNDSNLLFVAGRVGTDERYDRNGSVTIGGRGKIGEDVAIGVNAGVDFYKTDITSRDQTAVSFGLEGFTSVFDLHVNYRLPVNNRRTIGYLDPNSSPAGTLSVENNRLIERKRGWRLEEVPLAGANAEIGATAALSKDLSLRGSLSGFDYRDDAASKAYRGVRGGLELGIEDPLGTGGRFSVGAELQNDNRWGTQARGTVRLSIPIGRGARDRSAGTSGLDRQMGERLRRDYVTPSGTRYTDLTSTGFAIDARTGVAFGGVYFTSGSGTAGAAGTSTATTTLGDAVTRAGANGIVVALGNAGTIASGGVTLATNQYLVGGASSVSVRHSDGSVSGFSFGGTNGTITGSNAGGAAITLGQGSVVRDVTVRGAGSGILANGVGGFALERVVIENTGAAGLTLTNTTGSVVVDGLTVRGGAGAGVVINGGSNVTLRNSIIGGGAGAIDINDAGGNLTTTLSSLTLSATGGTVLDIDGSGAGTVTVAGLSGINITGGNGETGGFAARNVTFDASATAGIQAVNAGAMQVGTTTARVGGAGVTLTDVDGALSFANLNIANNGGTGLTVNNTKTGTFTLSTAAGTTDTTAGAALNLDPLLIDLTFSSVRSTGAAGAAIVLDNVQGAGTGGNALTIGALTILNSGQQGLFITGGSTGLVTIGGGSITNSGGASVQVGEAGVAGSGGTIGLNFGATITDAGAGPLVSLFNTGGAIRFTGAISGAGPITIGGTAAGSSVTFAGATTITGSTSPALSIDNTAGGVAFTGLLTIANPAGTGIVIGNVPGGVTFGDVDITGLGAGTGVNFTGTHGNVTFGTLDITGTGAAGSTGIDLTGATNAGAITIANPSVIQGVDIGVNLTNANITGSFRYGDGNAADGLESRITANTVIVVAGMNATHGTYDFADVNLDGNTNNITGGSFTAYYVLAGASGAGTANDPGSIAGAAASGAQYIVLLNNPNGGQDVIDTSGLSGGALSLTAGQSLVSFLNSDFFAVTGATVPANLIVSNLGPTGITNTYTGSGAAVLTSSTGGSTVVLANNTTLDGVIIHNDTAGTAVVGAGVSNVIIRNSTVSGNGGAISIFDGINAASVTLTNVDLSASGGTVLTLNGGGGGTLNVSGTDVSVTATGAARGASLFDVNLGTLDISSITTGSSSGTAVSLSGLTGGTLNIGSVTVGGAPLGGGVAVTNNAATLNIGSVAVANTAGVGLLVTDNSGSVTVGPVSVANSGNAGVALWNNSGAITLGATTVSGSGSDAVSLSNNGGTIGLGTLTLSGSAGAGLWINNNSGSVTAAGGSITGAGSSGVVIGGVAASGSVTIGSIGVTGSNDYGISIRDVVGTVTFTGTTSIANSSGIGLGTGSSGAISFGDVDITALGAGLVGLDARQASGTVTFGTLDITGTSTTGTRGIDLTGASFAGNLIVSGSSTITGVGTGVDLTNAAITGTFRFGDGSSTDANGAGSTISATTPIVIAGLNALVGTYDFADVNLAGDISTLATSASVYWVLAGASGAGSKTDPGSLAGAAASGADVIILINNPAGGNDVLDANDATYGTGGTFTLINGQQLRGFLNGDTITLPGGAPANIRLYGIAPGLVTNPFAGSGAPTLTTSAGGASTVVVTRNNLIDGLVIANGGIGSGVFGSGATNVTIRNSWISGTDGAIDFGSSNAAAPASIALSNLRLWAGNGSTALMAYASGGGSTTISQLSNITIEGGHGEAGGAYFGGATFDADTTTAGFQAVDASLQIGSAVTRVAGAGLDLFGALGALNFTSLGIYNQGSTGLRLGASALSLSSAAGTIDTVNGTSLALSNAATDLVLDRVAHAGTNSGILITDLTGTGTGGRALTVANLGISSASGNGIWIGGDNNGTISFGAASNISGTALTAITLSSGTGTLDFRYDGSVSQSTNVALLDITNHSGAVTFGATSTLSATNGTGLRFTNADGSYAFNGTATLNGGDAGIDILGGSAGSFTFGAGTTITSPSGPAFAISSSTSNVTYLGTINQATAISLALAVSTHSVGTLDFSGANVNASGGLGLTFNDADGTYSFGNLSVTGGGGVSITNGSAGNFSFGAGTSIANASGAAFSVSSSTANVSYAGSITQSAFGTTALDVAAHSAGTLDFTGATFNVTGGNGLSFNDADGTYNFGAITLSGGARLAILGGSAGNFTFGDVDITGLAANTTAADLTGATGNVTFATLDISGASTTGTRGIDLTGSTAAGNIIISGSSTITGVGIGVDLTNAAITGNFRFGDGSNTDADGAASSITAVKPLVIAGLNGGVGTYDFLDVKLNGDTTNLSVSAYFVQEGATGIGTWNDPGSLAGAEASGATYIVLLNDPTGGSDTLDATAGAGGSLDLAGGQALLAFRDVDRFTVGGGAPINVKLFDVQTGEIVNPFTGSGAPTLTASGANATVTLAGNNTIDGVVIANSGTGAGVLGNGVAGINTIRNSTISGGAAGAIRFYDNAANTVVALQNLTLAANGGNILALDGTGAGTLTVSALSNLTALHTTETGGFVFADVAFDADTATAGVQDVAAGDLTLGTVAARINGTALNFSNVSGTLNFGNLNIANDGGTGLIVANSKANNFVLGTTGGAVDTTNGTAIDIDPLTVNMTLGSVKSSGGVYGLLLDQVQGSFTVTGTVDVSNASNTAIAVRNNTGAAFAAKFQGAVTVNGTTGAGVALTNNTGATIDFTGGLGITTTTGRGFFASGGGTLSVTGTGNTITTGDATALVLGNVTVANAGVSFNNITAAPAAVQALVIGGTALNGALNIGGLNIGGGSTGVLLQSLSGSGGVNFTGTLDLDTTGVGFDLNGAVGTVNIANASGSTLTIDGASTGIRLNGMTGGTVNVGNNGGLASIGAITSSTVAAIGITGTSGGTLNYGGTIKAGAGSVLSVFSSSMLATLSGTINSTTTGTAFSFFGAGGIYTISGSVNHTGGTGVDVNATSNGNVSFLNASKTFSTGANTAISMAGTGTLTLLGGGLGITTTSGTGFSATAGTVAVLGSGNTITTDTGQILRLSGVTSGSGGITFDSLTAAGTVANNGILLSGLSGAAFNGGIVNIGGTSGAANDGIKVATGTAAITFGDTTIGTAGSNAIELLNSNSAVTFGTMNLAGANGSTVVIAGSGGPVTLGTGTITATGAANYAVSLTGGTADVSVGSALNGTNLVQIVDHETGTVTFSGDMASTVGGISVTNVNSGLITFTGQTLALNATAFGVTLAGNSGGTIDFNPTTGGSGLDIVSTGTGFTAGSGGTVIVRGNGNSISTTGTGTALSLQNVTIGLEGFTFGGVSANGATTGILLNGVGTVAPAIGLGTVNLQGITSRGIDVTGILGAGLSITDLDIGLSSNSAVALDLNGATVSSSIIIGDFDVTNSGGAGTSIGVDLRGTTGHANILLGGQLGASSSIAGVGTGIYLNAATDAQVTYGDGESGIDTSSTISATTAINASAAPTVGTYDFRDVAFSGSPGSGFGLNKIYFVDSDGAAGGGDGSGSDGLNPMTLAAAELAAANEDIIVLINNGSAISAAGSNGNNSLVLAPNAQVRGFGNGSDGGAGTGSAPIVITLTVPSTILLSGGGSVSIADPTVTGGAATLTSSAGSNVITLAASGNHLSGFILDGGGAASRGIKDNGAGASNTLLDYLTVRNFGTMGIEITPSTSTTIDHVLFSGNPGGDVLLNAANSVLTNITSNGGDITLNNATGTTTLTNVDLTGGAGLIFANAAGTINATNVDITNPLAAGLTISGGTASFNFDSDSLVRKSSAGASLSIGGGHTGGTFVYAGTLDITGGTGLQFDNADGTYNFTGTTTLAGGNAGIDILNGSGGTFSFGTNTAITSPSGTAFNVSDSTAAITYSGSITQANNAALVSFLNHSGGTVTFQTGTLSATNGTGLQFDNADGTYNFTGTTTLNGGDAGIDIVNGSAGTFGFGTGASITHAAAGDAFVLTDSNATLTYSGNIDDSNGHAVRIDNHDAGDILFQTGTITSSGANALGISLSNSNGGTIRFTGQTTLSTQANNALVLSANAGGTIEFSPTDNSQDLFITTTSGTAITMSGGGIFNVLHNNSNFNRIATGSGTLFDISNATAATTTLNLRFVDARNTGGASPTNGILISRTAGTLNGSIDITAGAITATNRGIDVDGGSLSLTYNGTIATSGTTARSVEVTNMAGGTVALNGNLTDTALGINVSNNSSGSVAFYGPTIALTPVANQTAVTLSNNGTTSISFSSAAGGNGFDIVASGTGKGIDFTGGGNLLVYGPGASITTQNGQILNLVNGNANSALGINFDSLASTGSIAGTAINISNIDGGTLSAGTVSITGTSGATADGIFYGGGSTMNVSLGTATIGNIGGDGIEINGSGNGSFAATSILIGNIGGNGVEINGSTNSVTLSGGSISGATYGVHVLGGTGAVSVGSSITKTASGNVVFVDGHSGGNLTFSGNISATGGFDNGILVQNVASGSVIFSGTKTLSTGAYTAVRLLNNSGAINFLNGGLAITTTDGAGFQSTAGVLTGTVTVEGAGNTISSGLGTALTIINNNIGGNGVTFQSISSNGAANGILLNNTGSSGGLRVTGTGTAGSGGTIRNSTGDGISLTGTENVRLAYMNVRNNRGNGIGGSNVNGFLIDNLTIEENGTDNGTDESGINLVNLRGSDSSGTRPTGIFNSTIRNNNEFEVQISNSSGTLTNFQVVNSTFSANGTTINGGSGPHGNLFNFLGTGTSVMGISVSGSSFTGAASVLGSGLFIDSSGTSMDANIAGSTFTNNNNGINISTGPGSTAMTYRIDGNTITGSRSTAINDFQNGNAPFTRTVNGTITNNIIGTAGVAQSGSTNGNGISISNEGAVTATYLIKGNTIQQIGTSGGLGGAGISVITGLFGVPTGGKTTSVTIQNNTISNILNDSGITIINAQDNSGTQPKIAVSLSGNGFVNTYNNQNIYLESSNGGQVLVEQLAASASANANELDDKNGGNDPTKIVTSGTITYGQAIPDLPTAPVLP
ncbi:right-handed parallel beta-helix repeat-containing protein [Sphingomonas kyeonggiensis]|uniref:Autotransporter domain-containing protein n=1 Tax=Sphingomonas kyeonggiensis TaxID=1268553 RepID=A0A7W6NVM0_9SPHN|nr:right-handed parallel beta-helix repeat-containing protein [Sphingomonas kyeonggiensis]MBB4098239.1 hypothetical protein [Sphingomonas kyeonggiensis]